mmetsp:Transcript_4009/g.11817  ORF Transcript_4009/g.11817 Transcript_4009/m.11817 type:complete len:433 (+) Transcript_4009:546-1844(+)
MHRRAEGVGRHQRREPHEAAEEVRHGRQPVPPRARVHARVPREPELGAVVPVQGPELEAPVLLHVPEPRVHRRQDEEADPLGPVQRGQRRRDDRPQRHEEREGVLGGVPEVDPPPRRRAHVRVLAEALREAEPDGQHAHGRREDLLVPEGVCLFHLVVVRVAERAREEEGRAPGEVQEHLDHGRQYVRHVGVHEPDLREGRPHDARQDAPELLAPVPGPDQALDEERQQQEGHDLRQQLRDARVLLDEFRHAAAVRRLVVAQQQGQEDVGLEDGLVEDVHGRRRGRRGRVHDVEEEGRVDPEAVPDPERHAPEPVPRQQYTGDAEEGPRGLGRHAVVVLVLVHRVHDLDAVPHDPDGQDGRHARAVAEAQGRDGRLAPVERERALVLGPRRLPQLQLGLRAVAVREEVRVARVHVREQSPRRRGRAAVAVLD